MAEQKDKHKVKNIKEGDANGSEKDKEKGDSNSPGMTRSPKQQQQPQPASSTQTKRTYLGDELQNPAGVVSLYRSASGSFHSEILLLDLETGELGDIVGDRLNVRVSGCDELGTQRVYKKTSPNCALTMYLPSREITLQGQGPSILRGIVYVDPKAIEGYRIFAQLTLTFRYGREDEEVMGLRFCNEAIMSLHQVWPRHEEPARSSLSPLQEALVKRLGEGAHPFTLTLTSQAPPSVQLVPAKRYYGAPIGTSYDVRCFIADKTDEKFHRRASVKMGVRVIYRADVYQQANGPENFASLFNSHAASPPFVAVPTSPPAVLDGSPEASSSSGGIHKRPKSGKSERGESFPKLRLSPKAFRFSGRFGRSKSEIEKNPSDPFHNYSKSFQEYELSNSSGGPQGAVDKPFLLQDGRVGLRASLDKAWYSHGEDVCVTVNVRNDSRKTVRKIRVCAIQHVDVCMFNNGKFKNVVADSDTNSPSVDRTVLPGGTLNTIIVLRPQRGHTKNWIALEDTLQRSTEPDEITGAIAASAIRSPGYTLPAIHQSPNPSPGPLGIPHTSATLFHGGNCVNSANNPGGGEDRNVFAIYVSYYVKVKLTLSGMGGELSLKLPFVLVHVDEEKCTTGTEIKIEKLALGEVPANRKNGGKVKNEVFTAKCTSATDAKLDRIESADDEVNTSMPISNLSSAAKRRLVRSETIAKDLEEETVAVATMLKENEDTTGSPVVSPNASGPREMPELGSANRVKLEHVVQIHAQGERANQLPEQDVSGVSAAQIDGTDTVVIVPIMSPKPHNSNV